MIDWMEVISARVSQHRQKPSLNRKRKWTHWRDQKGERHTTVGSLGRIQRIRKQQHRKRR